MSQVANFYNKIAKVYPVLDIFLQEPKKRLLAKVNQEKPGSLLEIGVGRGDNLPRYKHGPVTGIDVSDGMLSYARKKAPAGCTLRVMDAARLEFPDCSFDYSVIAHVLTVVPDPAKVMDEVYRVVKPGGKIYILNHESAGPVREKLNRKLAPLSRLLHFSSLFDMDALIDPLKFSLSHKARHGLAPSITLMVLRKNEEPGGGKDH
jgi:phosphatidylethanolamine/phosphatidyl-N-methylethanolamine N-methyltransferase